MSYLCNICICLMLPDETLFIYRFKDSKYLFFTLNSLNKKISLKPYATIFSTHTVIKVSKININYFNLVKVAKSLLSRE